MDPFPRARITGFGFGIVALVPADSFFLRLSVPVWWDNFLDSLSGNSETLYMTSGGVPGEDFDMENSMLRVPGLKSQFQS